MASVVGSPVVGVEGLREGEGPWLLRLGGAGGLEAVVLRTGDPELEGLGEQFATEAAALVVAGEHGVAAPRLLAADLDGRAAGTLAVLSTVLPGSSRIPVRAGRERLRALGAAAAALHAVPLAPGPGLPLRTRPIADMDFAALRRAHAPSPLFEAAELAVAQGAGTGPGGGTGLVHGDLWQGNVLLQDDTVTGFVDWDAAGAGHFGVDLGSLRCDAAVFFGERAAAEVLTGWTRASDREAPDPGVVAYWDLVAALSTPPDLAGWLPALTGQGRPELDAVTVTRRRDGFLRSALRQLGVDVEG